MDLDFANELMGMIKKSREQDKIDSQKSWNLVLEIDTDFDKAIDYISKLLNIPLESLTKNKVKEFELYNSITTTNNSVIITFSDKQSSNTLLNILKEQYDLLKNETTSLEDRVNFHLPYIYSFYNELTSTKPAPYFNQTEYQKYLIELEKSEKATIGEFTRTYLRNTMVEYFTKAFSTNNVSLEEIVDGCMDGIDKELNESLIGLSSDYYREFITVHENIRFSPDYDDWYDIAENLIYTLPKFKGTKLTKIGLIEKMEELNYFEYDEVPDDVFYSSKYKLNHEGSNINSNLNNTILARDVFYKKNFSFKKIVKNIISWNYIHYIKVRQERMLDEILKEQFVNPTMTIPEMITLAVEKSKDFK